MKTRDIFVVFNTLIVKIDNRLESPVRHCHEEVFLAIEVEIDRPFANANFIGDAFHPRIVKPQGRKYFLRSVNDLRFFNASFGRTHGARD